MLKQADAVAVAVVVRHFDNLVAGVICQIIVKCTDCTAPATASICFNLNKLQDKYIKTTKPAALITPPTPH